MLYKKWTKHGAHEWSAGLGFIEGNTGPSLVDNRPLYGPHKVPENMYQAMMEADFGQEPSMSSDEREADWLLFETRINAAGLTEREALVIDCVIFGQMTLAETGQYLARAEGVNKAFSRQRVHNIRNRAFDKLRKAFTDELD
jgi:hypothetical protein